MKKILLGVIVFFLALDASGFSLFDADGRYLNRALPTATETHSVSPHEALQLAFSEAGYTEASQFSRQAFWHKLTFPPSSSQQQLTLKIGNYMLDELNIYLFHDDRLISAWQRGDTQVWQPPQDQYAGLWIPVTLDPYAQTHILIRKKSQGPLILPLAIYRENSTHAAKVNQQIIWTISLTALSLLLLYNLGIYLLTRSVAFVYYAAINTGIILSLGVILGFGPWVLPMTLNQWLALHILTLHSLMGWSLYRFSMHFLNIRKHLPWFWNKRYLGDGVLLGFAALSYWVSEYYIAPLFFVLQIALSTICIYWAVNSRLARRFATQFYLLSWCVFLVGAFVGSLLYWGLIPFTHATEHVFLAASITELFGFSFAFSERIRQANKKRHYNTLIDTATGLPNRQFFLSHGAQILDTYRNSVLNTFRVQTVPLNLVMIRLTSRYNLSQAVGLANADFAASQIMLKINLVLLERKDVQHSILSGALHAKLIRTSASVCVFLTRSTQIDAIIQAITPVLEKSVWLDDFEFHHHADIGVAQYPTHAENIETLFQCAQQAVSVNHARLANWTLFDAKYKSDQKHQLKILSLLTRDLKEDNLHFYVQPQVSLKNGHIVGGEVLLRWTNHELGNMSPAVFIPLAEGTGLILKLTQFIIRRVFQWLVEHPEVIQEKHISINISVLDLLQPNFARQVIALQQKFQIDAPQVILEITETLVFEHNNTIQSNVLSLRSAGFKFSIDDFGTGYSSMQNILLLSPYEIKLDRVFVQQSTTNSMNKILCDSVIQLSKKADAISIAEGIETEEELQLLKTLGCDLGQGYYLYYPMPPEEYLALVTNTVTIPLVQQLNG